VLKGKTAGAPRQAEAARGAPWLTANLGINVHISPTVLTVRGVFANLSVMKTKAKKYLIGGYRTRRMQSFTLSETSISMLSELSQFFNVNKSRYLERLITEAHKLFGDQLHLRETCNDEWEFDG
jgi:hypothetical protein